MYNEEFEGLEEGKTPRAYVSDLSQQDAEKLARENEKLKKNLEKEKFFNRLLDQELKEVKAEASARFPADFKPKSGISKGAFYALLILALGMASFIFYTFYFNNAENSSASNGAVYTPPSGETQNTATRTDNTSAQEPDAGTTNNEQVKNDAPPVAPSVKDSVPNIVGNNAVSNNNAATAKTDEVKKKIEKETPKEEYNEAEVEAILKEPATKKTVTPPPAVKQQPTVTPKQLPASVKEQSGAKEQTAATTTQQPASTKDQSVSNKQQPAPVQPSRPVIAHYKVTSKANFYNSPDENTLRSAFISGSGNKTVNALEDKNGFIYVEYVNEYGMTSKGWLSKKDLTKAE